MLNRPANKTRESRPTPFACLRVQSAATNTCSGFHANTLSAVSSFLAGFATQEAKDLPDIIQPSALLSLGRERSSLFSSFPSEPSSMQLLHEQLPVPMISPARRCQQH